MGKFILTPFDELVQIDSLDRIYLNPMESSSGAGKRLLRITGSKGNDRYHLMDLGELPYATDTDKAYVSTLYDAVRAELGAKLEALDAKQIVADAKAKLAKAQPDAKPADVPDTAATQD